MGRKYDTDPDEEFYAERLQVENLEAQNRANRLLAPMTRAEWYGSLMLAIGLVLLAIVVVEHV